MKKYVGLGGRGERRWAHRAGGHHCSCWHRAVGPWTELVEHRGGCTSEETKWPSAVSQEPTRMAEMGVCTRSCFHGVSPSALALDRVPTALG